MQLVVVLAFVLLSLLGGIFRKIQEQRELQRRRAATERARLEMLRTGRVTPTGQPLAGPGEPVFVPGLKPFSRAPMGPPTTAAEALARLEEIARRRQEQVGKVRGGSSLPPKRRPDPGREVVVMGPAGPVVVRPGSAEDGGSRSGPTGRKPKPGRPGQRAKTARPSAVPPPSRGVREPEPVRTLVEQARTEVVPAPVAGAQVVMPSGTPRTPAEWRRLVAATAIFGRPVGEGGGGASGGVPERLF
jgi:hypothetical protein